MKQTSETMDYNEFIANKQKTSIKSGFKIKESKLNPLLKPHQTFGIIKALEHGLFALFYETGLGKTIMELEIALQVSDYTNGKSLILAPLAVVNQTKDKEAAKFGYTSFIGSKIDVINYEQIDNIDVSQYSCVILDESSILKSIDGKTKTKLINLFKDTPYKYCFSATPSPNDHMELGNHSEFLNQMSYTEMLAMFFVHDGGETSKWRLRKHAEADFWNYVLSWSIAMDNPATFGFESEGYDLPEINYIVHDIAVQSDKNDLFGEAIVSATDLHQELKKSFDARLNKALEIYNEKANDQWLFWCLGNEEAKQLQKIIPESVNVQGSDKPEVKANMLNGFVDAKPKNLITKTKIASFGMNYQHASNMIFTSYDFKFEAFYQAVRRCARFGNMNQVNVHILKPMNQSNVLKSILEKERKHKERTKQLSVLSSKSQIFKKKEITMEDVITDDYKCLIGDCVQRSKDLKDNELDFTIFSPPFSELYVYSDKQEDMGNSKNYNEFEKHFKFLIPEIKRTLKPGRICAVHCMDLPIQKGKEGFIGLRDFSGMLIDWFTDMGFIYHSRVTIWKNPVTEMQRTKALGLLHKTIKKDASMSRVGIPDYVLFFRNEGENEIPVEHYGSHEDMKQACKKDNNLDPKVEELKILPVDLWQKYASPIWYDIDYGKTLQYTTARDSNDEKHICPLQLETIERCIHLYTNPKEKVGSFFGGIGSEGFKALKMGRKSVSIELKESYFKVNVDNHKKAMLQNSQINLF
jgi:hypothetical protein